MDESREYELRPREQAPSRTRGVLETWQAMGSIRTDYPCVKCGYNLRTLRRSGRCPECGLEISVSLGGDELQYADRMWLGRLATGTLLLALAAGLYVAGVVLLTLGREEQKRLGLALGGLGAVCDTAGTLFVTCCEPRMAGAWGWSVRKALRLMAWLPVLAYGAGTALLLLAGVPVLVTAMMVVATLKVPPTGVLLYALARRIPNDTLAWRTNNFTWGLTAGMALTTLAGVPIGWGWMEGLAYFPLCVVDALGVLGTVFLLICFFVDLHHAERGVGMRDGSGQGGD